MKKTFFKGLSVVLVICTMLTALPTVFAGEGTMHPAIKDVVEGSWNSYVGEDYFGIDGNIYDAKGHKITELALEEDEAIVSVGENAIIVEKVTYDEEENISCVYTFYEVSGNELIKKGEYSNDCCAPKYAYSTKTTSEVENIKF